MRQVLFGCCVAQMLLQVVFMTMVSASVVLENTTDFSADAYLLRIRRQLNRKLTISTVLEPPYMMLKQQGAFLAGNDRFEGYLADILKRLATSIGFEYEIRLARDGKYGELANNGNWDGILGEVHRGESDIAAGPLAVTEQREEHFDFTESFLSLRSSALLRKPKTRRARVGDRVNTADQLLASDVIYGVIENSVTQRQFERSTDSVHRALWARIATFWPSAFVHSPQEGVERARRERYAFILDSPMAEYVASRRPCDLYASEPFLDVMTYAFAMRKADVRLRHALDRELRALKNSGDDMQMMYLNWWRDECGGHSDDGAVAPSKREDSPADATARSSGSNRQAAIAAQTKKSTAGISSRRCASNSLVLHFIVVFVTLVLHFDSFAFFVLGALSHLRLCSQKFTFAKR